MVVTVPTGRTPHEMVEVAPTRCANGHQLGSGQGADRLRHPAGRRPHWDPSHVRMYSERLRTDPAGRMRSVSPKFEIAWTKNGDRGNDPPEVVTADTYSDEGPFIDFMTMGKDGFFDSRVLRVRASDVQAIRELRDE